MENTKTSLFRRSAKVRPIDLEDRLGHDANMVAVSKIHACVREVAEKFRPSRIILFGFYAYGNPTDDSDIDLLVVMNHKGCAVEQAAAIRSSLRSTFPIDVLVRSPRKVRERMKTGDPFFTTIVEKGEVLYEATGA